MPDTNESTSSASTDAHDGEGFSVEERAAIKERAKEVRKASTRGPRAAKVDGETEVRAKIAEMTGSDRETAEKIHALVKANAPDLSPKLWYGMPAYAKGGKVVCFFQSADKFNTRYATFGFNEQAALDDGSMWPTAFALTTLTPADEIALGALIKKAAG